MEKYSKILTKDGTISFYNKEVGDIYHSNVGAYTEALEKFVKPSSILKNLHNYKCINVLDVCFGLGYNSKVLASSIFKIDPQMNINITAIEIDPEILLKSIDVSFEGYQDNLKSFFDDFLHKVYYSTVSGQYNGSEFFIAKKDNISLKVFVDDARNTIKSLNNSFDLIFLDPFSPQKLPCMWSVDLFKCLYYNISENGRLLTYSSSHAVRSGLLEAGFLVGNTLSVGRRSPGTIAVKNPSLITTHLTNEQRIILETTAGIPFEDPELRWSNDQIIFYRKQKQKESGRISANKAKKRF